MNKAPFFSLIFAVLGLPALAGEPAPPIQDNSFTVEEAYNQEAGVVQHIVTWLRGDDGGWAASFTEEWPVAGQRHQLGFTATYARLPAGSPGGSGPGDLFVNWRIQALGDGESDVAIAPRASLIVPTGDEAAGLGAGSWGFQGNLPVSVRIGGNFVGHSNLGFNWIPGLRSESGEEASAFGWFAGQSFVWLARPRANVLVEALYVSDEVIVGPSLTRREHSLLVTPGVRFAVNLPSGMQIVPALAASFGFGDARDENSILLYLSVEHFFGNR